MGEHIVSSEGRKREQTRVAHSVRTLVSRYGIWIVLLGVLAVYVLSLTPHIGPFDSAWYVVLSKSIATGQGYRNLQQVGTPPHTHFPFGFPLLLSPVWLLFPSFPDNAYAFKLIPVLFGIASWVVFYLYLQRNSNLGVPLNLAIVLMSALTPLMVFFAAQELMSETSYMFFSFLSLLLFERVAGGKGSRKLAFGLAIVALAMSYFIRTVGLSLLIAVVLYFALKRDWKRASVILALFGLLISPWIVRNLSVGASPLGGDYGQDMWFKDYARPDLGYIGSYSELIPRVLRNGYEHMSSSLMWIFLPQLGPRQPTSLPAFLYKGWVKAFLGFVIICVIACGMAVEGRRRKEVPLPVLYTVVYMGPVLLQPWVGARNLIPIMPILFYYFFVGLGAMVASGRFLFRGATARWVRMATGMAAVVMLISFARSDRLKIYTGLAYHLEGYADPAQQSLAEACRWIETGTVQQARFFATLPNWLYLYTERGTVPIPGGIDQYDSLLNTSDEFTNYLFTQGVDYVVLQPERPSYDGETVDFGENPLFRNAALSSPDYALLYDTHALPRTLVFEVLKSDVQ